MRFGYFNNQDKEYIITNPKTPVKWINYIGGLSFGGFIDQTGGSLICKNDPAMNRIVKYIPQLPQSSFNGETLYIRIKENNHYKVFSPFFTPTLDQYESYKCHVGLGYSKYVSVFYGIETTVTVFVPLNDHREIRVITVKNKRQDEVQLDIIPVVEYTHFEAMKQFNNADWVPQTMTSEAIKDDYNTILLQYAYMRKNKDVNFFTSNYTISSFETDRRYFLGENEYGTFQNPFRLKQEELSNYEAKRGDNIGALMHHLKPLKPNEEQTIITQLGQTDNIKDELSKIEYYRTIDKN
jgi:cellobiose phosphorylase